MLAAYPDFETLAIAPSRQALKMSSPRPPFSVFRSPSQAAHPPTTTPVPPISGSSPFRTIPRKMASFISVRRRTFNSRSASAPPSFSESPSSQLPDRPILSPASPSLSTDNRSKPARPFRRLVGRLPQCSPGAPEGHFDQQSAQRSHSSRPNIVPTNSSSTTRAPKFTRTKKFLKSLNCFRQTPAETTIDSINPPSGPGAHRNQRATKNPAPAQKPSSSLADIQIEDRVLGRGGFGAVHAAKLSLPHGARKDSDAESRIALPQKLAVKVVPLANQAAIECVNREWDILSTIRHENIISVFGNVPSPCGRKRHLVMERLFGPNLHDLVQKHGVIREADALQIMRHVLEAIHYMHEHGTGHLDIKPGNIVLKHRLPASCRAFRVSSSKCPPLGETHACLIDFGLSYRADVQEVIKKKVFCARRGTPTYAAPEVSVSPYAREKQAYAIEKADIWGCGATLFYMLYGEAPYIPTFFKKRGFDAVRERAIAVGPVSNVLQSKHRWYSRRTPLSRKCRDFLESCLQFDPDLRPTAEQALNMLSTASNAAYSSESEID